MHHFIPTVKALFRTAEYRNSVYLKGHFSIVFICVVLVELCEDKAVSDLFVFLEFRQSLSELNFGSFFDAVVKIAVLEHFFKLLFWDLQDLAFGTFAFGC